MPFDVLDFIPSLEIREECRRVGKTFGTREKAAIVSWSHRPMKDRLDAYMVIGEEDDEYRRTLMPITDWMSGKLESFMNMDDGCVFFSGRSDLIGGLDSCVNTEFKPVFEYCNECSAGEYRIMITKSAVNREYYETAVFDLNGEISHIREYSPKHKNGYDPEKQLNAYQPEFPCPYKKGDIVCYHFIPEEPMVFLEQQELMRFQYIGEDYSEHLYTGSGLLYDQVIYYKQELPYGELQIARKSVLGELDFVSALNLIEKCRLEKELDKLDGS